MAAAAERGAIRTAMTLAEKLEFAVFFLFLAVWNMFSLFAMVRPGLIARLWPRTSARAMRVLGAVFLVAGLVFCGFSLAQLGAGTFKWKGSSRTYGFPDLVR